MDVTIGKIIRPVGLRGELRVLPLTDFPERFSVSEAVTVITKEAERLSCCIRSVRHDHRFVYLAFAGYDSRDAVDPLRESSIRITDAERMPLAEGRFYQDQIEGLQVYQEDGRMLGRVNAILETGSNDVYVVHAPKSGEGPGKEYLIPALAAVVKEVNLAQGRMTIRCLSEWVEDDAV